MSAGIQESNEHSSREASSRVPVSNEEWDALAANFRQSLFRLEALPEYDASFEQPMIEAFNAGREVPLEGHLLKYLETQRDAMLKNGGLVERVHIVPDVLNPYLRWEIFWAYQHMVNMGMQVYLVPESAHPELAARAFEFYLIDEEHLIHVCYDSKGAFQQLQRETDPARIADAQDLRRKLLDAAIPFEQFKANLA